VSRARDDQGQIVGASKVARDITARKRAGWRRSPVTKQPATVSSVIVRIGGRRS
jgi:hypothetical protein